MESSSSFNDSNDSLGCIHPYFRESPTDKIVLDFKGGIGEKNKRIQFFGG